MLVNCLNLNDKINFWKLSVEIEKISLEQKNRFLLDFWLATLEPKKIIKQ